MMWLMSFVQVVAISVAAGDVPVDQTGLPALWATRQTTFSIPFRVDPVSNPRGVLLYVSSDFGATWHHCDSAQADQSSFTYRAAGEGEYWFRVRALDASGNLKRENPSTRPLRVAVDTTSPELSLSASRDPAGSITAHWRIQDRNPAAGALRLQYRVDPAQTMQTVAIDRNRVQLHDGEEEGRVTWWPHAQTGRVEIRAEVADLAGNLAVGHTQVNLGRRRVAENETSGSGRALWAPRNYVSAPTGGFQPVGQTSGDMWQLVSRQQVAPPVYPATPAAGRVNPAFGNRYARRDSGAVEVDVAQVDAGLVRPPDLKQIEVVNSRLFELDYELDATVSPGSGRVELWGTRDSGRSWSCFGYDNDSQSPMWVSVDEGGVYGFQVVLADERDSPTRTMQADIWIGVDVTEPKVKISSVEPAVEERKGRMVIRWVAEDWMLPEESVFLFHAATSAGPWTPIGAKMANSGEYVWDVTVGTPQRAYIRLEVRDRAGNVGSDETRHLISLSSPRSNSRIGAVRPLVAPKPRRVGFWK